MELFDCPIDQLRENPWNPNRMDDLHFNALVESIQSHPELLQADRLIVRKKGKNYEILSGAHRFRAAKKAGFDEIPIGNLGDIDDADAKLISLILNNHGEEDFDKKLEVIYSIKSYMDVGDIARKIGEDAVNLTTLIDGMSSGVEEIADLFDKTEDNITDLPSEFDFDLSMPETINNPHDIPTVIQLPTKAYIIKAIEKGFAEGKETIYSIINDACRLYVGE